MLENIYIKLKKYRNKAEMELAGISKFGLTYYLNFTEEGKRLNEMLYHKNLQKYVTGRLIPTRKKNPTKEDILLTSRLLASYEKACFDREYKIKLQNSDMWDFLEQGPHSDLINLLKKRDVKKIAYYLCNMSGMGATHGITQGTLEYRKITTESPYRRWLEMYNLDKLILLAEALGIITRKNPEQGESDLSITLEEMISQIELCLKIPILPPDIEGLLYKIKTKKGSFHNRDIMSLYTAWRIKGILKEVKKPNVCEIGCGLGKTAFYAYEMGIKRYTLIDLPHVNILQGFYLIKSLPAATIVLYGEKESVKKDAIYILPDWWLGKEKYILFDLVLNQDSFPEIDKQVVANYLKDIKRLSRYYFLSVNQESRNTMMIDGIKQNIVNELTMEVGGFELVYRYPYWLREGYVEELFKISRTRNDQK